MTKAMKDAQDAHKRFKKSVENMIQRFPKINIPKIDIPKLSESDKIEASLSPDVVREKNRWQRHEEMLGVQNTLTGILDGILKEQKATSKLTRWILFLAVASILIALASIFFSLKL